MGVDGDPWRYTRPDNEGLTWQTKNTWRGVVFEAPGWRESTIYAKVLGARPTNTVFDHQNGVFMGCARSVAVERSWAPFGFFKLYGGLSDHRFGT
jgi:hypothetical protein